MNKLITFCLILAGLVLWVARNHPIEAVYAADGKWVLVGWNDLGMHCMDADYSVFSILPPYNTIHAHLMDASGKLVKSSTAATLTYEAVLDASGSINTYSLEKTNFWKYVAPLFGLSPLAEDGLAGYAMPGVSNLAKPMKFDATYNWFSAEGIPITPYDDQFVKNPYPMMRLTARDSSGTVLATTDIVLPVSDEMTCSACHASGTAAPAKPAAGWAFSPDPERDYKLNILRLHDEKKGTSLYSSAVDKATPILCASCHASNALAGSGVSGITPLTTAVHRRHAQVTDPDTGIALGASTNRSACYRCHPGSTTRCLRGAMGDAVSSDGTMAMQCQNCHGAMSVVGAATRRGWLDEPSCQSCHTGTATSNNGQMRYTSAFDAAGQWRTAANQTFATNANTPATGASLFRFSKGHGGLMCEACHGSTHAEYPSSHASDNAQSIRLQGHAGVISECSACHTSTLSSNSGGPHGMHSVGSSWARSHDSAARNAAACQACHGADYRGTALSRALADRTFTALGTRTFWKGFQIGCYTCHNGPTSDNTNSNRAPVVSNASLATAAGQQGSLALAATDVDGNTLTLRIVSQPAHGSVALSGTTATYFPFDGYQGADSFTFAAWDGSTNSNLGTVSVTVTGNLRPAFTAAGVVNAASYAGGSVAPGEIVTIYGTNLGPATLATTRLNPGGRVAVDMSETRVWFDGAPAPIVYASAGQTSVVVPYSIAGKSTTGVIAEYRGLKSDTVTLPVTAVLPALFTIDASGKGQGAILNQDYTVNGPGKAAARGTIVSIYATGEGQTTPAGVDGKLAVQPLPAPQALVAVKIGGVDAETLYSGGAPGLLAGLIQINARVPATAVTGDAVPVVVTIGGVPSQTGATMAVK